MIANSRYCFVAFCILLASEIVTNYGFTQSLKAPPLSFKGGVSCSSSSKTASIAMRLAMASTMYIDRTNSLDYSQSLPVSDIGPHIKIKGLCIVVSSSSAY